jgi:hypothetical protein
VPTTTSYFETPLIAEQRIKGELLSAEKVRPSEETAPSKISCSSCPTSRSSKSQACTDLLDEVNLYFNENNKKNNLRGYNNVCRSLPSIQPESSSRSEQLCFTPSTSSSTSSHNNHDGENKPIVLLLDEEERRDDSLKESRQGGGLSVSTKGQLTSGVMSFDNNSSSRIYSTSAQRNNSMLLAGRSPSFSTANSDTPSIYSSRSAQRNNSMLLARRYPSFSTGNSDEGVSGVPPQLADVHSVQSKLHRLAIKKRILNEKGKY